MEKDAKRRGANRFKHSKTKLSYALETEDVAVLSDKSRREKKLSKLSSVVGKKSSSSHKDSEMDTNRDENEPQTAREANCSIRFKLSERASHENLIKIDDCTHTPVPRRIRSAMKKRKCDSISPRSSESKKKLKTSMDSGITFAKTEIVKKSKSNMKQGRSKSNKFSRGMASGPITKDEEEVAETLYALAGMFDNDDVKGKRESSDVPESNNSHPLAVEDILPDAVKDDSSKDMTSSLSKKPQLSPDNSVPPINKQTSSSLSEKSESEIKPTFGSVKSSVISELHLDNGSKQSQQNEVPFYERKPGMGLGTISLIENQMGPLSKAEEFKKNGLEFWAGLPSTSASRDLQVHEPSLPSSLSKLPAYLDVAFSNSRNTSAQYKSFGKAVTVPGDKRRSKRCATHVHISRLIQAISTSENKEKSKGSFEGLNQGVFPVISNFDGVVNGVKEVVSTTKVEHSLDKLNQNGAEHVFNHDHLQPAAPLRMQNYDLVARGSGMEVNNGSGRAQNVSDQVSPLQNHYLPPFLQNQFGTPYSGVQPSFNPSVSAYADQLSSAQQVQMQQYNVIATRHHHHHHQEHQKRQLWGTHYRPHDSPKTTIQFLSLQTGASTQRPQQQPLAAAPSQFSGGKVIRQECPLPLVYGEFRSGAAVLQ